MTETVDVAVIGAGVIGVCTAYFLAKEGRSIALIERDDVGSGCSFANACLITPSHSLPISAPGVMWQAFKWMFHEDSPLLVHPRLDPSFVNWIFRFAMACRNKPFNGAVSLLQDLARRSLDLFEGLIAEEGLHFDYGRRGLLNVYTTDAGFRKGLAEADLLGKHGLAPVTLDAHQARKLEPALSESIVGGVYYPDDAQGDCYSFVRQLSDVIRKLGVEIYTQTTVKGWSTDRSALIRIKTSKGDCCAKNLVIAAGSWSSAFYRDLGMRMPLQPGKGYSLTIDAPSVCPRIPLMNVERKVAITPIDRKLRFAGTMEFAGYNLSLNQNRVDSVLRDGEMVISKIENPKNIENWCGLRPCTPDGLPIIGRVSAHQNVYISTGHGMLGFTLGPISGQLLSKAILRRGSQTSLIHLGLDRF